MPALDHDRSTRSNLIQVLNIHETYDSNTLRQTHPLSHTDKLFHQILLALHLEYKYPAAEMDFLHHFDRQRLQAL